MSSAITVNRVQSQCQSLREHFLAILPRIQRQARIYFRHVRCYQSRDEKIAETVAVCWRWFLRLAERGKDANQFVSALATLAARAVNSGRRLCGQEKASDVLSPHAQRRGQFTVCPLPEADRLPDSIFEDALHDNTRTPPSEAAAFRIDFSRWLRFWSRRDRRLIHDLMLGEGTLAVARKHQLTAGRVSQLRRQFHLHWLIYCGDLPEDQQAEAVQIPSGYDRNGRASFEMGGRS